MGYFEFSNYCHYVCVSSDETRDQIINFKKEYSLLLKIIDFPLKESQNKILRNALAISSHLSAYCEDQFIPLIIQDNCENIVPFSFPDTADAIILNHTGSGLNRTNLFEKSTPLLSPVPGYQILRDFNLLGATSIFFNSRKYAEYCLDVFLQVSFREHIDPDRVLAIDKPKFEIYTINDSPTIEEDLSENRLCTFFHLHRGKEFPGEDIEDIDDLPDATVDGSEDFQQQLLNLKTINKSHIISKPDPLFQTILPVLKERYSFVGIIKGSLVIIK